MAILIGLLFPVLNRARSSSHNVGCLANLRQIASAFQVYAQEHDGYLPPPSDPRLSDQSWESLLKKYLAVREIYHCQADGGMYERLGSSYDWRDQDDSKTTLAGRRLSEVRRADSVLAFDALPDWHSEGRINAVFIDGSSQSMDFQDCLENVNRPIK